MAGHDDDLPAPTREHQAQAALEWGTAQPTPIETVYLPGDGPNEGEQQWTP